MSCTADRGAALLLVTGATAVLAMLTALMLAAALASYEARSYRADLAQARALADAVVLQATAALGDGELPWPGGGASGACAKRISRDAEIGGSSGRVPDAAGASGRRSVAS